MPKKTNKISGKEQKIIKIFNEVSLKDQDILIRRFINKQTQAEVGAVYNMTNERVRQLEERTLETIKEILK